MCWMSEWFYGNWAAQGSVNKSKYGSIELPLNKTKPQPVSVEEVNRVLEVGRLLFSVLTPEEIEELQELLNSGKEK